MRGGQRGRAVPASFAGAGHMRAGAGVDVAGGQCGELADPQPGLYGQGQQCPVTAPGEAVGVRGVQQRFGLFEGEELHGAWCAAPGGQGQDPCDGVGVLGVVGQRHGQDRPDRGEPGVAGDRAVAAHVLEVVQERGDRHGVEQAQVDLVRWDTGGGGEVFDQQPPGVAVGRGHVGGGEGVALMGNSP